MTKVALIGCGGMGNHHARVLTEMENVEIAGVCDIVEEKAQKTGQATGAKCCTDYHELLDEADAVWVCTEPFNRLDIVTTAAAAGKHIFTEKPICVNLDEADQMIAAAAEANVKYMLGYVLRFTDPYRLIRETFADGRLGELVTCWTRRYMPFDMSGKWYGRQDLSGGVALDFGSHDVDWLRWVGGDVRTVFAAVSRVRPTMHADEHAQTLMVFDGGGMGTVDVSWSSYLSESSIGVIGAKGSMIVGRDGKVRRKIGDEGEEEIIEAESAMDINPAGDLGKADGSGEIQAVAGRAETIQEHFFRCIEEDVEPLTGAQDGRKTLATVKAIHESARRGQSVAVAQIG